VGRDEADVLAAARRRAQALVDRDATMLAELHHPALRWTTFRGDVLDRARYVRGNTESDLVWLGQQLDDPEVVVAGDTAVLTAMVHDEVERDGVSQTFSLRLTQTWIRTPEGWRCLAGHAGPAEVE
jgi:Domain of unknown function (DUF4440)